MVDEFHVVHVCQSGGREPGVAPPPLPGPRARAAFELLEAEELVFRAATYALSDSILSRLTGQAGSKTPPNVPVSPDCVGPRQAFI